MIAGKREESKRGRGVEDRKSVVILESKMKKEHRSVIENDTRGGGGGF